jgi:hypothetical protein
MARLSASARQAIVDARDGVPFYRACGSKMVIWKTTNRPVTTRRVTLDMPPVKHGTVDEWQSACDAREDCLGFARKKTLLPDQKMYCYFKGYDNSAWVAANESTIGYKKLC